MKLFDTPHFPSKKQLPHKYGSSNVLKYHSSCTCGWYDPGFEFTYVDEQQVLLFWFTKHVKDLPEYKEAIKSFGKKYEPTYSNN